MIAEAGLAALWLAAGLAAFQCLLMVLALSAGADVSRAMRSIAVVQGILTLIAFAMLLVVFARSDMSVALVFENSNSAKPFIYKVAGAWGNHEGSMLMWVTILAVAGAFLGLLAHRTSERTLLAALGAQAVLALGFYAFLLFASNPFARLWPAPPDGRGAQPAAAGSRPRVPSADALPRLCRPVGRLQPRRRRAPYRRSGLASRPRDAAVGARRLDPAHARNHRR